MGSQATLYYSVFSVGSEWMGVLGSESGLLQVTLLKPSENEACRALDLSSSAELSPDRFADLVEGFRAYYRGEQAEFADELDLNGATPFQRDVWQAARRIPHGRTHSYSWLAEKISKPGAARAVGQALGRNSLPVIVPCHRVLAADGGLGGYSGGIEYKKRLLRLEKSLPAEA